jgi:hypothetical protein
MNYDGLVYILLKYETSSGFKAFGIGSIEFQYNSSIQIHGLRLKFCEWPINNIHEKQKNTDSVIYNKLTRHM